MTQSIPQQPTRRHHYIPAFYTKRWATDGKLLEYRRVNGGKCVYRRTAPEGTGWMENLYAIKGLDGPDAQKPEELFFKRVDSDAALLVEAFLSPGRNLAVTEDDRAAWATFLLSLLYRTPEDVTRLRTNYTRVITQATPDIQARWDQVRKPGQPESVQDILDGRSPSENDMRFFEGMFRLMQSETVGTFLIRMVWKVIDLGVAPFPLLTSDRPVIRSNGFRAENGHIAIPLSPSRLFLAAKDERVMRDILAMTPNRIARQTNLNVVRHAHRFVYAHTAEQSDFVCRHMATARQDRLSDYVPPNIPDLRD